MSILYMDVVFYVKPGVQCLLKFFLQYLSEKWHQPVHKEIHQIVLQD